MIAHPRCYVNPRRVIGTLISQIRTVEHAALNQLQLELLVVLIVCWSQMLMILSTATYRHTSPLNQVRALLFARIDFHDHFSGFMLYMIWGFARKRHSRVSWWACY